MKNISFRLSHFYYFSRYFSDHLSALVTSSQLHVIFKYDLLLLSCLSIYNVYFCFSEYDILLIFCYFKFRFQKLIYNLRACYFQISEERIKEDWDSGPKSCNNRSFQYLFSYFFNEMLRKIPAT